MATLYVLDVPTLCFVSEQFSVLRCCACGPVRLIHKTTWLGLPLPQTVLLIDTFKTPGFRQQTVPPSCEKPPVLRFLRLQMLKRRLNSQRRSTIVNEMSRHHPLEIL